MQIVLPTKKDSVDFIKNNAFLIVVGLLVAAKTLLFNELFGLTNTRIAAIAIILVMSAFIMAPYTSSRKRYKQAFIIDLVITIIIISDMLYLRYFGSLMSIRSIFLLKSTVSVTGSIADLFKPIDIVFVVDLPFLYLAQKKLQKTMPEKITSSHKTLTLALSLFFLLILISAFIYDYKNVKLLTTKTYDNRVISERYGLGAYHVIDIYSFARTKLDRLSKTERQKIINEAKEKIPKYQKNSKTATAKGKNIILLQVESLQSSVINQKIEGQEITPNINNLIKEGDYFNNHFFQLGNGGTSDSDFVVNTSLYPMKDASSFVQYGDDDFNGLADELKKEGYSTNAYHGFNRSFWNRNVALKSLGYDRFFGAESYKGYRKIQMGVNDIDFLSKTVQEIKNEKSPSLSYVITLTSHHPFGLPEEDRKLALKKSYPDSIYNYFQSIHYTDKAIGNFVSLLKKNNLFQDSLVVVYGDHSATYSASLGNLDSAEIRKDLGLKEISNDDLKERTSLKRVPLIIHLPGQKKGVIHQEVSGHVDIMPTILNLVGAKTNTPLFGRDLYSNTKPYYAAVSYFNNGIIITGDYVYADGETEGLENGTCYQIKNSEWLKTDINNCRNLVTRRDQDYQISSNLIKYNLFSEIK